MDVNKLGPGQRIAAGAALLLLIDLWLEWYSVGPIGLSAWQSFGFTDLLLFVTVIVALGMAAQAMGLLSLPVKLSSVLLPLAAVMTLIVLYRIINQPHENDFIDVSFGAFIGLILTAAVAYGAFRAQGEHEDVSAPGTFKVGSHTTTTTPATPADPVAPPPPPATTPPPAPAASDDDPPPPPPPAAV